MTVVAITPQTPVVVELYVTGLPEAPPVAGGAITNVPPAVNARGLGCAPKLMVWPMRLMVMVSGLIPVPPALVAEMVALIDSLTFGVPLMRPVEVLMLNVPGNPLAA